MGPSLMLTRRLLTAPSRIPLPVSTSVTHQRRWKASRSLTRGANKRKKLDMDGFDEDSARTLLSDHITGTVKRTIFDEEAAELETRDPEAEAGASGSFTEGPTSANTRVVLEPNLRSSVRWQRKKVIQEIRRIKPATRKEIISRTEREVTLRSPWINTSTKKMVLLARQIAGKRVDDALVQMKFSKKKNAKPIAKHLQHTIDLGVAQNGMGLGKVNGEADGTRKKIMTKDGKRLEVDDPTRMYISQAWVNRGPFRLSKLDYKARGRFGIIRPPTASISFLLKEERTRVREHDEKTAKERAKKPWVQLPDRPIYHQRPYYSW